ncbi:MAG: hypothetical protein WDO24_03275 [Pseudomonadota bacterium]
MSTGLLDHVIRQHPGIRVTVACGAAAAPLFAALPGLERVVPMDKRPGARPLDSGCGWRRSGDAGISSSICAVRPWRGLLRARARRIWRKPVGDAQRVIQLGHVLGLTDPPGPRIWLDDAHRAAARRLIPEGAPVLRSARPPAGRASNGRSSASRRWRCA